MFAFWMCWVMLLRCVFGMDVVSFLCVKIDICGVLGWSFTWKTSLFCWSWQSNIFSSTAAWIIHWKVYCKNFVFVLVGFVCSPCSDMILWFNVLLHNLNHGSFDNARDAIFYSYTRHINGFAAMLEEEEAAEIASKQYY